MLGRQQLRTGAQLAALAMPHPIGSGVAPGGGLLGSMARFTASCTQRQSVRRVTLIIRLSLTSPKLVAAVRGFWSSGWTGTRGCG